MKSNPFFWLACQSSGVMVGWSLVSGEPWRQVVMFAILWLVAMGASFDHHSHQAANSSPILDRLREPSRN
jgi:membrane protein implicated in regulation of membrane protease activity